MKITQSGRILVTGAAGMLGSAASRHLASLGAEVVAVDMRPLEGVLEGLPASARDRITPVCQLLGRDLGPIAGMGPFDAIVHLAANTQMTSNHDWKQSMLVELTVLGSLVDSQLLRADGHLLFASSSAVYGKAAIHRPMREEDGPLEPASGYGAMKVACEALLSAASELSGLRVSAIRPSTIASPDADRGVIVSLALQAREKGRVSVLGDGTQSRNFIALDDFVQALVLVLDNPPPGFRTINVASGEDQTTVRRVAELACSEFGIDPATVAFGERASWRGDVPVVRVNIDRLRGLGFEPARSSDEAALAVVQAVARRGARLSAAELERQGLAGRDGKSP